MLDAASDIDQHWPLKPHPGAISLCLYCGAVAVFGPDMLLYPPDEQTLDELAKDEDFVKKYMSFSWARQYVMIQGSLMRGREEPDR
jgi:hypothetical protein